MHINHNRWSQIVFAPLLFLTKWLGINHPVFLVKVRYFVRFKKRLDLNNPKNLNEKMLYLSLKTDTTLWTRLADKYSVQDWVRSKGLEHILIPQYQYIRKGDVLDLNLLPKDGFVLKTTHGCGDVMICKNQSEFDMNKYLNHFKPLLESRFGALEGGKHYLRIEPGLVVEKLLTNDINSKKYSSSIIDYKFWCFNGKPTYCWVCCNRDKKGTEVMTYDLDWNAHPEWSIFRNEYRRGMVIPKPINFSEMIRVCEILSKDFPCVSVDLYNIGGKIYFGEMTFTRLGGLIDFFTEEFLMQAGNQINISDI